MPNSRRRLTVALTSALLSIPVGAVVAPTPSSADPGRSSVGAARRTLTQVKGSVDRSAVSVRRLDDRVALLRARLAMTRSLRDGDVARRAAVSAAFGAGAMDSLSGKGIASFAGVSATDLTAAGLDPQGDSYLMLSDYAAAYRRLLAVYDTGISRSEASLTAAHAELDQVLDVRRDAVADRATARRAAARAQARLEAARERAAERASRSAARAARVATVAAAAPASGAAQAVAYALAQVGDAYVYGAAGPSAWDCSGLTMMAWGSAGRSLPHSSGAQLGYGTPVAYGDLQPGDLVFYYSPVSHVVIYIGNGMIVHAGNPSIGVRTDPVGLMPFAGARRL